MNKVDYSQLVGSILLPDGTYAWDIHSIQSVLHKAQENNWIVLGGDVLTIEGHYTYDSWYYSPEPNTGVAHNVELSIVECKKYIHEYVENHGERYLFSVALSDSYVSGTMPHKNISNPIE